MWVFKIKTEFCTTILKTKKNEKKSPYCISVIDVITGIIPSRNQYY